MCIEKCCANFRHAWLWCVTASHQPVRRQEGVTGALAAAGLLEAITQAAPTKSTLSPAAQLLNSSLAQACLDSQQSMTPVVQPELTSVAADALTSDDNSIELSAGAGLKRNALAIACVHTWQVSRIFALLCGPRHSRGCHFSDVHCCCFSTVLDGAT